MKYFDIWQASECARLNITIEQHNRLLEIATDAAAARGVGSAQAYADLIFVIKIGHPDESVTISGLPKFIYGVPPEDDIPTLRKWEI